MTFYLHAMNSMTNSNDFVLLTNGELASKLEAHLNDLQHYAYSVFIFNTVGEMLLQQRASSKYHSAGLWSNACCSHPLCVSPINKIEEQARKRINEEMGMDCNSIHFICMTAYNKRCGYLWENEIDYIFRGSSDATPHINVEEVKAYKWISIEELKSSLNTKPSIFTEWFLEIINKHFDEIVYGITSKQP